MRRMWLFLIFIVIVLFLSACDSSGTDTFKQQQDKAKTIALNRNANDVLNETKKYGVEKCSDVSNAPCAEKGVGCKAYAVAYEPSDCQEPPTIKCICPEKHACVTDNKAWKCLTSEQIGALRVYGYSGQQQGEGGGGGGEGTGPGGQQGGQAPGGQGPGVTDTGQIGGPGQDTTGFGDSRSPGPGPGDSEAGP